MRQPVTLIKAIVGSQAYGTNTPDSDIDTKGVYIQHPLDILSFGYKEQIQVDKDNCLYEVKRFLELLCSSNPTMLELLFIPENCILEKHPLWDIISKHRNAFITKECKNSFMGYAKQQIHKAKGLNKKMNWEKDKTVRKRPIDFMKVISKEKTYPLTSWLSKHCKKEDCCGLVKVNDTENIYCLFYDEIKQISDNQVISNPRWKEWKNFGYKGICTDSDILVSEVPSYQINNGDIIIYYNKNGFQEHCKDYNSYQTWLKERNITRYVDVKNHNQMIDGKNLMHCYRLLQMSKEIATTGTLTVRRENANELLDIRKGNISLQELINNADALILEIEDLFDKSTLLNSINKDLVNNILESIRISSFNIFNTDGIH